MYALERAGIQVCVYFYFIRSIGELTRGFQETKNYEICPAIIDGEQYLFIDTPGFGAAEMGDMDCFHDIIACLYVLGPVVTIAGLIFVTGGNQERLTTQELKTMKWIQCFCGPEFYKYVTIMTNKWDKISEDDFEEAWESMQGMLNDNATISEIINLQNLMISESNLKHYEGGHIYHHGIVLDEDHPDVPLGCLSVRRHAVERAEMAVAMIKNRYEKAPDVKLQVVHEMGNNNISWRNTEAAKVLKHNAKDIKLYFRHGILQVFVEGETQDLFPDESEHGTGQLVIRQSTDQSQCVAAMNTDTQLICRPVRDDEVEAEEQSQTWLDRVWSWILIAKDAAVFFMGF